MFVLRELQLIDLLVWFTGTTILDPESAVSLALSELGRSVSQGRVLRRRLPGMETEPNWTQCWQASANYGKRQLDVRPKENGSRIVNDVVRMLDVFFGNRVCSNDASNAHGTYTD
jgi:hypothetical protein